MLTRGRGVYARRRGSTDSFPRRSVCFFLGSASTREAVGGRDREGRGWGGGVIKRQAERRFRSSPPNDQPSKDHAALPTLDSALDPPTNDSPEHDDHVRPACE